MARPLNKRQRAEVQSIVRSAISPEWKVYQRRENSVYLDFSSMGPGYLITGNIAQGLGASDRIGDQIRIKRIDFWLIVESAQDPIDRGPIACAALVYRRQNELASYLGTFGSAFDLTLVSDPWFYWAPTPQIRDLAERGIHISKLKRWKMMGLQDQAVKVGDTSVSAWRTPGEAAATFAFNSTGTGAGTGSIDAHALIIPRQERDYDVGSKYRLVRWTMKYPGAGLRVTYANAALSITAENMLYVILGAETSNAHTNAQKPNARLAYRIYFTDD